MCHYRYQSLRLYPYLQLLLHQWGLEGQHHLNLNLGKSIQERLGYLH